MTANFDRFNDQNWNSHRSWLSYFHRIELEQWEDIVISQNELESTLFCYWTKRRGNESPQVACNNEIDATNWVIHVDLKDVWLKWECWSTVSDTVSNVLHQLVVGHLFSNVSIGHQLRHDKLDYHRPVLQFLTAFRYISVYLNRAATGLTECIWHIYHADDTLYSSSSNHVIYLETLSRNVPPHLPNHSKNAFWMNVWMCTPMCSRVCLCVYEREREREKDQEREREKDQERERERQRERERERKRDK